MLWNLDPYWLILRIPVFLISLSLHEFAHAKVADMLGDKTPRFAGRLTLNPRAHIDPFGFIAFFLAGFGWARPVPVNPYNFKGKYRQGFLLVGIAGPLSNILLAGIFALLIHGLAMQPMVLYSLGNTAQVVVHFLLLMVYSNISLAVFNLLPLPPLDGSRVLAGIVPERMARKLDELEVSGITTVVLLVLFYTGIIRGPMMAIVTGIAGLMGL